MSGLLALDLQGTRIGWVLLDDEGRLVARGLAQLGVRHELVDRQLKRSVKTISRRADQPALRALDARALMGGLIAEHTPSTIAYEHVVYHAGGSASAHGWGAVEMAVLEVCTLQAPSTPVLRIGVSQGKRALAGNGGADKARMLAAAQDLYPGEWSEDEADALGIGLAARGVC